MAERLHAKRVFIGTGDYIDMMSPSNRQAYRQSGLYSSTMRAINDRTVTSILYEAEELLKPHLEDNTILMAQGHHWMFADEYSDGFYSSKRDITTYHTDKYLAYQMGARFVQSAAILKIKFDSGRVYKIMSTHGQGNGATLTYGLNKQSKAMGSWTDIDAYFMGHTHKAGLVAAAQLYEKDGELEARQTVVMTCGAFLKSYLVNEVHYPEEKHLAPLALSAGALLLSERDDDLYVSPMILL
jgi:hypothetical protein